MSNMAADDLSPHLAIRWISQPLVFIVQRATALLDHS
jgi:hypothetical protein